MPGDLNGDGAAKGRSLLQAAATVPSSGFVPGDTNGDGLFDVNDIRFAIDYNLNSSKPVLTAQQARALLPVNDAAPFNNWHREVFFLFMVYVEKSRFVQDITVLSTLDRVQLSVRVVDRTNAAEVDAERTKPIFFIDTAQASMVFDSPTQYDAAAKKLAVYPRHVGNGVYTAVAAESGGGGASWVSEAGVSVALGVVRLNNLLQPTSDRRMSFFSISALGFSSFEAFRGVQTVQLLSSSFSVTVADLIFVEPAPPSPWLGNGTAPNATSAPSSTSGSNRSSSCLLNGLVVPGVGLVPQASLFMPAVVDPITSAWVRAEIKFQKECVSSNATITIQQRLTLNRGRTPSNAGDFVDGPVISVVLSLRGSAVVTPVAVAVVNSTTVVNKERAVFTSSIQLVIPSTYASQQRKRRAALQQQRRSTVEKSADHRRTLLQQAEEPLPAMPSEAILGTDNTAVMHWFDTSSGRWVPVPVDQQVFNIPLATVSATISTDLLNMESNDNIYAIFVSTPRPAAATTAEPLLAGTTPPPPAADPPSSSTTPPPEMQDPGGSMIGIIAGGGAGALVVLAGIVGGVLWWRRRSLRANGKGGTGFGTHAGKSGGGGGANPRAKLRDSRFAAELGTQAGGGGGGGGAVDKWGSHWNLEKEESGVADAQQGCDKQRSLNHLFTFSNGQELIATRRHPVWV